MIIDFHTHIFPESIADMAIAKLSESSNAVPYTNGTEIELKKSMEKAGVDFSVVLPVVTNPVKADSINKNAARINEKMFDTGIISFGGIHPDTRDYKEVLKNAKELGLKGIKLHPDYFKVDFDDIRIMHIIEAATELGLVVVTHAGKDIGLYPPVYCTPDQIVRVMNEVKPEKLVLAHMGGWQLWDEVIEKMSEYDLYLDTAFSMGSINWKNPDRKKDFKMLTEEKLLKMINTFGSSRILFATDSPWAGQKEYVDIINKLPISEEERDNIFGNNARKLLCL